jgi:hypothetical protein
MRTATRGLLVLLSTLLLASTPASAADGDWSWFRSVATGSGWWITDGHGDVSQTGDRFEARLRDGQEPLFVRLTLRGTLSDAVVSARVRVENSDARDFEMSGRLTRQCWSNGGREIVILSNRDHTDMIGLQRNLGASTPCRPVQ